MKKKIAKLLTAGLLVSMMMILKQALHQLQRAMALFMQLNKALPVKM